MLQNSSKVKQVASFLQVFHDLAAKAALKRRFLDSL
jgi:hypothetical protein